MLLRQLLRGTLSAGPAKRALKVCIGLHRPWYIPVWSGLVGAPYSVLLEGVA